MQCLLESTSAVRPLSCGCDRRIVVQCDIDGFSCLVVCACFWCPTANETWHPRPTLILRYDYKETPPPGDYTSEVDTLSFFESPCPSITLLAYLDFYQAFDLGLSIANVT